MAKTVRKKRRHKPERAYLIRGYDEGGILRDTAGFYFSREEAEAMKEESRELGSEYEYSIEEFERFPVAHWRTTGMVRQSDEGKKTKKRDEVRRRGT